MKSIIYKSLILLAVGSFLSCKKDAVQHTCAINSYTTGSNSYTYTYDTEGRVISITSLSSTVAISYGNSNIVAVSTTTNGTTETAIGVLNSNGCLVSLNSSTRAFQMTYDNNNRLLSMYVNAGGANTETITYTYNTNGDMMSLIVATGGVTSLSININDWDTNANPAHFEPLLFSDRSLYKLYGNFSNHLPKAFNYNNTNYTFAYTLNSNGYIESLITTGGGSSGNYTFNMTCN